MTISDFRRRLFHVICKAGEGDRLSRAFDLSIIALIILSVVSIILQSFDDISVRWAMVFSALETVTVIVFTLEYAARIWTADLLNPGARRPRLRYMTSLMAIVDLMAILPFYLPFVSTDLRFLRLFRLFQLLRLMRVLKLGRYFEAFQVIVRVIRESASQLVMSIVLCLFVMLFSAIVMYTAENPVQPDQFPNVVVSLWWAICTLTTVGYGDVYPITPVGRFLAAVISLVGIGVIAIPTGIIAAGFSRVIDSRARTGEEKKLYCPYCGKRLDK